MTIGRRLLRNNSTKCFGWNGWKNLVLAEGLRCIVPSRIVFASHPLEDMTSLLIDANGVSVAS